MPLTALPDMPSPEDIDAAEAAVRAQIVTDYVTAVSTGDWAEALAQDFLAAQLDAANPDGPRLTDELAAVRATHAAA